MSGLSGLEEHLATAELQLKYIFAFLVASSMALIESRFDLAGRSSNEVLEFTEYTGLDPHHS